MSSQTPNQVELEINQPSSTKHLKTSKTIKKNDEDSKDYKSDIERSSLLSRVFFLYIFPLCFRGWKKIRAGKFLEEEDMITFPRKDRGDEMEAKYLEHMRQQKLKNPNKPASTALAVAWTVKWQFLFAAVLQILFAFVKIFLSWVMKRLIENFMDPRFATTHAFWWAAILAGTLLIGSVFENHWIYHVFALGGYVKGSIVSMLYSKITKLSVHSITKLSPGKLMNIVTNDLNFFDIFGVFSLSLISGWVILIACTALLWIYFGVTCLIGVGYLVATLPIIAIISRISIKPKQERNVVTDERLRKISEAIDGIRLLKMYTWETKFIEQISSLRKKDVALTREALFWSDVLARSIKFSAHHVSTFLMFMLYYVTGGELTIAKVFSGYSVLGFIRFYFVYFVGHAFDFVVEAKLLFQRLDKIMEAPEMGDIVVDAPLNQENSVEFDSYTGYWGSDEGAGTVTELEVKVDSKHKASTAPINAPEARAALTNINLNLKKGSTNAVVGSIGSGKTSFLLAFTGEIPKNIGNLRFKGRVAYVEQEPTIFAGTVRESILFGNKFNEEFYNKVIKVCNLESDLKLFPQGDMSFIEERGTNLSGGQRARIALARAVYADADIYLLDDPLSAVDTKVAKSLYNDAIQGILKEKTVILVTHQVHFVREAENIIVMEHGKVAGSGTFEQLQQQGVDVNRIFSIDHTNKNEQQTVAVAATQNTNTTALTKTTNNEGFIDDFYEDNQEVGLKDDNMDPHAGQVSFRTYVDLFKEVGLAYTLAMIVSFIFLEFGEIGFGRILGAWTSGEFDLGTSLGALGGIAGYMVFIYLVKNTVFTFGLLRAATRYHKKMLEKVMRSPVSFFDTNPVGRIVGRFAGGIGVLDKFFPLITLDVCDVFFLTGGVFLTLAIIDPVLIAPLAGALIVFLIVTLLFYPLIKHTKYYEMGTAGPLFSLLSSSISGISIIRTYGQAPHLRQKFRKMLYANTKGALNFTLAGTIMGFGIDLTYVFTAIGMIYITAARIDPNAGSSSGAVAAFTLALLLSLTGVFQWGVRMFCLTNVLAGAAASVQAYCNLPSEAPLAVEGDKPLIQKNWPKSGEINFNQVYMKYRAETDHVIKNLNMIAQSGEKIGCVGRTGAGKSTIINLLFRLQEIDRSVTSGSFIKIDNTDTLPLGLHLLRGNISIIPQVPFIFTGTIRQNIDPLYQFTDEQVWNALDEVRLKGHVEAFPEKLNTNMANAAAVFSVGQKQLICLARTILRPSKILVLDEATANMDSETDNFIQKKIMEKFANSTIFTIAHRLSTIANYDKVLVLDKGTKMEFDAPYKLLVKNIGDTTLTNTDGFFGSMVMNTGPKASQRILNIAKEAYEKNNKTVENQ